MSMKNIIHAVITVLKCVNPPMPVLSNANPAVSALMASIEIKKEFAFQKMLNSLYSLKAQKIFKT